MNDSLLLFLCGVAMLNVVQDHCLNTFFFSAREHKGLHLREFPLTERIVRTGAARVRDLLRLSRRHSVGLGVAVLGTAAVTAFTARQVVCHLENAAAAMPLAPPPAAPPVPRAGGVRHHLFHSPLQGLASWYGAMWNGHVTASGEAFDERLMTAAHRSLPLGTIVRVTNLASMRSVTVRINDRGALAPDRIIDLSSGAARELGMVGQGLAKVRLEVIGKL